jgi:peptide/nickel transport system permease protein/oligopeptide transport system permease protein
MTELSTTAASAPIEKPDAPRQRSPLYFAWRRFTANKAAVGAGIVLIILMLMAIFAPVITQTGDNEQSFLTSALAFPSAQHWFGVDDLGRDFFARIVYGARVSLGIGFSAALVSLVIGLPLGALAGYSGGRVDWVIMRVVELFSVVPPLLAALLLATVTRGGVWAIVLIAALFGWKDVCILVRAQVKSFREKEFIMAAQALGASPWHIIWRHLIPNSVSPIIVGFVLAIPLAMMLEASLSFLGIGVQPPTPSWGQMINVGMNFMFFYWHMAVFPTGALAITILATSLLGDGLRDAFDPTLKGR